MGSRHNERLLPRWEGRVATPSTAAGEGSEGPDSQLSPSPKRLLISWVFPRSRPQRAGGMTHRETPLPFLALLPLLLPRRCTSPQRFPRKGWQQRRQLASGRWTQFRPLGRGAQCMPAPTGGPAGGPRRRRHAHPEPTAPRSPISIFAPPAPSGCIRAPGGHPSEGFCAPKFRENKPATGLPALSALPVTKRSTLHLRAILPLFIARKG